ncbi:hypothetical protein M2306_002053 [Myroides gitamensis]|uniref:hypothetical protein n=1 Tax=Myroides odoratus TaxID=256 RepID=UPI0021674212|nr:hypothetical protein [Myroides odoratus]MCS4239512.1 hypothetical protein [Myroides odoratus]MDH6601359.1 hypothetical protein [Myroides gitamensis]
MRSREEIKGQMTEEFLDNEEIVSKYKLDKNKTFEQQFSKVSLENLLFDFISFGIWILEGLFDLFKKDIDDQIAKSRVHTQKWYREKALAFMYGYSLNESDVYDTEEMTEDQIERSKIIANAAAQKIVVGGRGVLRIKVVKKEGVNMIPLVPVELQAFTAYMNLVADAGTYVQPTSDKGDNLKLKMDIYYDPLVLDTEGKRLDGTKVAPVSDAIENYLRSIEFNGEFIKSELEDVVKRVEGVLYINIKDAWTKYASYSYETTSVDNAGVVDEIRRPDSGYLILDKITSTFNYRAYEQ